MMPRPRSRLRVVAALLSCVGMLAWPVRTVAACPMPSPGVQAAVMHPTALVPAMDDHGGHDMMATQTASPSTPPSDEAPVHERCPDLAHCAMVAVPTPLAMVGVPTIPAAVRCGAAQRTPMSVAIALEPPPPKV